VLELGAGGGSSLNGCRSAWPVGTRAGHGSGRPMALAARTRRQPGDPSSRPRQGSVAGPVIRPGARAARSSSTLPERRRRSPNASSRRCDRAAGSWPKTSRPTSRRTGSSTRPTADEHLGNRIMNETRVLLARRGAESGRWATKLPQLMRDAGLEVMGADAYQAVLHGDVIRRLVQANVAQVADQLVDQCGDRARRPRPAPRTPRDRRAQPELPVARVCVGPPSRRMSGRARCRSRSSASLGHSTSAARPPVMRFAKLRFVDRTNGGRSVSEGRQARVDVSSPTIRTCCCASRLIPGYADATSPIESASRSVRRRAIVADLVDAGY